jgi:hypothetical protein
MDVVNVDRTAAVTSAAGAIAEIATLRQKLAAAEVRIRERGRHNTTEAYKDNGLKPFTSWKSDETESTPTLDDAWLHFCAT